MPSGIRVPALLVVVVAAAYVNSFAGTFQFDDYNVIVDNPTVHSLGAWLADLGRGIRPVLKLTYLLNWVAGPDVAGFHAFNLAVHLASTLLVYALARMLAEAHGLRDDRQARVAAMVAALLFGLHPAQTEAVTYVSGRSNSLMAMLYLGGLAAYAGGVLRSNRLLVHLVSPALFVLAVATKEVAITFPVALLWWEASRRQGPWDWRAVARRQASHWGLLLVATATLLAHPLYGGRIMRALDGESLLRNALAQVDAISYLLLRFVRLFSLDIDPDLRIPAGWNLTLAVEAGGLAALAIVAMASLRSVRWRWWGLGLAWFALQLLPTNSVIPRLDLANDRHLYLASFGLFVATGIEAAILFARRPRAVLGLVAVVAVVLGAATVIRNRDYASEVALWEQTAQVSPGKPRVFNNLAYAYWRAGRPDLAEAAWQEALRLHPGYELARENLDRMRAGAAAPR